ncbi:hypothetical protein RRG08_028684 [Elysia crispata]|uniref:Uncharacterized protein n=1 Tax=Elysia crispata TaxID=231223 RepID=A0AAE1B1A0_9GAST|nr:hypothetical protein RRG08_028684 [Elysia crispata]
MRAVRVPLEESSEEEESDQDSDDTEAQEVRGQGTGGVVGPRLNMILPDDLILEDLAAIWMSDTEAKLVLLFYTMRHVIVKTEDLPKSHDVQLVKHQS